MSKLNGVLGLHVSLSINYLPNKNIEFVHANIAQYSPFSFFEKHPSTAKTTWEIFSELCVDVHVDISLSQECSSIFSALKVSEINISTDKTAYLDFTKGSDITDPSDPCNLEGFYLEGILHCTCTCV